MDRNIKLGRTVRSPVVAPLAGSVDRNIGFLKERKYIYRVAPLAGSVDQNAGRHQP